MEERTTEKKQRPSPARYPVRGVDVSSHNGEIDWPVLSAQDISFVYMKATEGSDFIDRRFAYNYAEAQKTALRVGAYHFWSYTSAGKTQAENYINTVPRIPHMLPPVIDVELLGKREWDPPAPEEVRAELSDMIALLTAHYGGPPVLYASAHAYRVYLMDGAFSGCDIWIRDVVKEPRLPDGRAWTFWQYTDTARLPGYVGGIEHIDMNVFCGSAAEFAAYRANGA